MVQYFKFKHFNEYIHLHRYWGKIIGLKCNYYILECEWKNKELEYKITVSSKNFIDFTFLSPMI